MADHVGQQLGNYRLIRLLGEGGFAEVYLGEQVYLRSQAAIKVLQTHLTAKDEEGFLNEAKMIARLNHPYIVHILGYGAEEGVPFLVMEYAPQGTLRTRHPKGSTLPARAILPYVRQVAEALDYAHEQKLIHRDVKPENMLLNEQGQVLLSDFGIATAAQSSQSGLAQEVAGTVPYMAPEQLQGHAQPASDQYSLGIVVYEWLTGERPFQGGYAEVAAQHVFKPPRPPREINPLIPPLVQEVVLIALSKDPKARFASVRAFATALEAAAREEGQRSVATQPQQSLPPDQPAVNTPALAASLAPDPQGQAIPTGNLPTPAESQRGRAPAATAPPAPGPPRGGIARLRLSLLAALLVVIVALSSLGAYVWTRPQASAQRPQTTATTRPAATCSQAIVQRQGTPVSLPGNPLSSTLTPVAPPVPGFGTVSLPTLSLAPYGLAILPDCTIFFTENTRLTVNSTAAAIGRLQPDGQIDEFPLPDGSSPGAITVGPDGNLWFGEAGKIGRISPDGSNFSEFSLPPLTEGEEWDVRGIVSLAGNLWFLVVEGSVYGTVSAEIGRITPQGDITLLSQTLEVSIGSIAVGPDSHSPGKQAIWFTEEENLDFQHQLGELTPDGQLYEYPEPFTDFGDFGSVITYDPVGGNLWFLNSNGFEIGRIKPDGTSSQVFPVNLQFGGVFNTLAPDSNGDLWTLDSGRGQIVRIAPDGISTLFLYNGIPWDIASAPDGTLWFTDTGANTLGYILPDG